MKCLSARDVLKALPHYKNEFQVIDPLNDLEVYAVLDAVGFDSKRGICYEAALHRDMAGVVAVGYRICGEYNTAPEFRKFHDMTDRLVIAYAEDPSLGRELDEIRGKRFDYKNKEEIEFKDKSFDDARYYSKEQLLEMGFTGDEEEDTYDGQVAENYDVVSSQIELFKTLLVAARGE
jgi:hypothetical protein